MGNSSCQEGMPLHCIHVSKLQTIYGIDYYYYFALQNVLLKVYHCSLNPVGSQRVNCIHSCSCLVPTTVGHHIQRLELLSVAWVFGDGPGVML